MGRSPITSLKWLQNYRPSKMFGFLFVILYYSTAKLPLLYLLTLHILNPLCELMLYYTAKLPLLYLLTLHILYPLCELMLFMYTVNN